MEASEDNRSCELDACVFEDALSVDGLLVIILLGLGRREDKPVRAADLSSARLFDRFIDR